MAFFTHHTAHEGEHRQQIVGLGDLLEMPGAAGLAYLFLDFRRGPALGRQGCQEIGVDPVSGGVGDKITHGHLG